MPGKPYTEWPDELYLKKITATEESSKIQEFFKGANIFITGASGFLGNLLVEKLLRSCCKLSQIYILMREKKGINPQKRFEEMFNAVVFDRLNKEQPNFLEKVSFVTGDCGLPNLGLSPEDKKIIMNEVNIVFHSAATVRFDEKLRLAAHINVRGTKELLLLAKEIRNLKAFVHISTAFSNCVHKEVGESFYETMDGDKLLRIVEELDDAQLEILTPNLKGKWPNTYAFTKAVAENIVARYGKRLPVTIFRPSVVISTYKEPVPGWINNFYGPVGVTLGVGVGVLHVQQIKMDNLAELVPADYCINAMIAAAWQVGIRKNDIVQREITQGDIIPDDQEPEYEIPIFNYVSSPENPITWNRFYDINVKNARMVPTTFKIWHDFFIPCSTKVMYIILSFFLHILPGTLFDTIAVLSGKEPRLMKVYKKIHKMSAVITYFSVREWRFHNNNTQALWKELNKTDKKLFEFDMKLMNWKEYFYTYLTGLRIYLLKDPLDTIPQGLAKSRKLKIVHYTVEAILSLVFIITTWLLINFFSSF